MRLSLALLPSLLSLVLLSACSEIEPQIEVERERAVKLLKIESTLDETKRVFPAKVVAQGQADMAFRVSGNLIEMPFLQGEEVKQGQVLAQLDDRDAKNLVLLRESEYELAQADFKRKEQLLAQSLISKALFDDAKARLKATKANLASARDQLSYTKLVAPFDGVIAKRVIDNYQTVQATQIVLTMQRNDVLDIVIQVPEALVQTVDKKQVTEDLSAFVRFAVDTDKAYPVTFKEFSTQVNPYTQSYEASFNLSQPEDIEVLPGMSAELTFSFGNQEMGISVIPMAAVSMDDSTGASRVWLYDENTQLVHSRIVELGQLRSNGIEVVSGLSREDVIVAAGVMHLKEAMRVKPLVWQRGL